MWYRRERTAASKQNVDAFNLQLQNLRYEVLHLRKEVSRCINFRSADENIRLVPVEEFYREADPDISQPDTTQGDDSLMEIINSVTDPRITLMRIRIRILHVTLMRMGIRFRILPFTLIRIWIRIRSLASK